jgi:hypothetical protein
MSSAAGRQVVAMRTTTSRSCGSPRETIAYAAMCAARTTK